VAKKQGNRSAAGGKVKVGVIGAGGIAMGIHLPSLRRMESVELVAVCDLIPERAAKAAAEFDIPNTCQSYPQMLQAESLDAVLVLTEPDQLYRPAMACLAAGKHVFMEKPPGITAYQAGTLLRAARAADRILMVGLNRRYIPLVQHVLKLVRQRSTINQVDGRFNKHSSADFYGGCASALECDTLHVIDLVRWIAGGQPVKAALVQGQYDSPVPNSWNGVAMFDNGVTGIVRANYQTAARVQSLEIHGPNASAFVNLGFGDASCTAELMFFGGKGTHSLSSAGAGKQEHLKLDGREIAGSDDYRVVFGYEAELRDFIECIQTRRRPLTDIEEGLKSLQMVEMFRANLL